MKRWSVPAILFLALVLRLLGLTFHSLWLDEAVSAAWARLPMGEILARGLSFRHDTHPPLYYMLLRLWSLLFGDSEVALRGLSVVSGVALVAFIYGLGKEMGGERVGLSAGLLAALNPYLIWYSQEVRMYALVGMLSTAGFYCLWRGLNEGKIRWWIAYLVATVASLYTQTIAALLLPLEIIVALLFLGQRRRYAAFGLITVGLAGLAFLPIVRNIWNSSGATSTERVAPTFTSLLTDTAIILTVRQVPLGWQILVVPVVVLAVLGMIAALRRETNRGLTLLLYIAVILTLIYYFSATRLPIFGPPYIIVIAAPFLVAVALGSEALWQQRRQAGFAALLAVAIVSLFGLRYDWYRGMGKEDWRSAAHYIAANAAANDCLLAVPDYASIPLRYYLRSGLRILEPFGEAVQPEAVGPALADLDGCQTVWFVQSHGEQIDPQGYVRHWLMERYPILTEQYPRGVEIRALAVRYRYASSGQAAALAVFDDRLCLIAAQADAVVSAGDEVYHPPSGWVHVNLAWQSLPTADLAGLRLQVRVIDNLGRVWGERLMRPSEVWQFYPPQQWQAHEIIRDAYDVNMNPKTPSGRYRVELQVLDRDGKALPVKAEGMPADRYFIADVEVR